VKAAILAAMLALPHGESTAHYPAVAEAIEAASWRASGDEWKHPAEEMAAALVAIAYHESHFSMRIQSGQCRLLQGECDASKGRGGQMYPRARSMWQIQKTYVVMDDYAGIVGASPEALHRAAWAAALVVAHARERCAVTTWARQHWEVPTLSGYATGYTCSWRRSWGRRATLRKALAVIETPQSRP